MQCEAGYARLTERLPVVVALLLLIPLGAWLVNPDLAYITLQRDGWLYHGYFLDLRGHLRAFSQWYYSSRLSMTVPGWVVYKCVPVVVANHVLHLLVYLAGTLGLYATVRQTIHARVALLAALLLGGHFYYLQAASSDYCDGYGMAYFLLATAAAARAVRSPRWRSWLLLTGLLIAALVVTNLSYVLLLPPLGVFLFVLNRTGPRYPLDTAGFWLGAGAALLVAGLAAISLALGGPLDFLAPSLSFAHMVSTGASNPFKYSVLKWLGRAGWLLYPAAAAVGAIVYLVVAWVRASFRGPVVTCYEAMLLGMFVGLGVLEGTSRGIFLQCYFYAPPLLLPLSMLAIAGQWEKWVDGLTTRAYHLLVGVAVVMPIAGASVNLPIEWVPPLVAVAALPVLALLLPRCHPRLAAGVLGFLLLMVADATARLRFCSFWVQHCSPRAATRVWRGDMYRCIDQTMRKVRPLDPGYQAAYWYDRFEPLGPMFDSIASMGCYRDERMVNIRFPEIEPGAKNLEPGRRVILLASAPDALERARRALAPLGVEARVLSEWEVASGPFRIRSYLLETRRSPAETAVSKRPPS